MIYSDKLVMMLMRKGTLYNENKVICSSTWDHATEGEREQLQKDYIVIKWFTKTLHTSSNYRASRQKTQRKP